MAAGKRKRGAGFSERERFEHKSAALLQREAKKVRAFLARKAVQQLKQQRAGDSKASELSAKQQAQVAKRERELAALKALDLKLVVARAFEATGLSRRGDDEESESEGEEDSESEDEMPVMAEEEDDSGFDSEEYEREKGIGRAADGDSSEEDEGESGGEEEEERVREQQRKELLKQVAKSNEEQQVNATLVDRILAHKQMLPLLDAIRQWCVGASPERCTDGCSLC